MSALCVNVVTINNSDSSVRRPSNDPDDNGKSADPTAHTELLLIMTQLHSTCLSSEEDARWRSEVTATSTAELRGIIVKDPSDPTLELIRDFYVTFCKSAAPCYIKVQTGLTVSHRPDQSGLCWDQFSWLRTSSLS